MKVELCPEDMLLEYVENRLSGKFDAVIRHEQYLKHLPHDFEPSEEFAARWQTMVSAALKRFNAAETMVCQRAANSSEGSKSCGRCLRYCSCLMTASNLPLRRFSTYSSSMSSGQSSTFTA